jgi:hypothetical protein
MSDHGWVYPRPDGAKARCGGPSLCGECMRDQMKKTKEEATYTGPDILAQLKAELRIDRLEDQFALLAETTFQTVDEITHIDQRLMSNPNLQKLVSELDVIRQTAMQSVMSQRWKSREYLRIKDEESG